MIDETELRIGNLLKFGNIVCAVCEIDGNSFRVLDDEGIQYKNTWADLKPIPLTEEWLIKFGFNKTLLEFANRYVLNGICIFETLSLNRKREGFYAVAHINVYLTSVHQLQNLYFALTGEELELKEETK